MKKQSGFTLIELMIVVAIVAILAAIAMPAYQSYTARSKFSEVSSGASALKTQVQLCFMDTGNLGDCDTGEDGSGWVIASAANFTTKYIDNISVTDGVITATASSGENLNSSTYVLNPVSNAAGSLDWSASGSCKTDNLC